MPPSANRKPRRRDKCRTREIQRLRAFGECRQHVQRRERRPDVLQHRNGGARSRTETFVEHLFSRASARSCADSARSSNALQLGVSSVPRSECLPAPIVFGDLPHRAWVTSMKNPCTAVYSTLRVSRCRCASARASAQNEELAAGIVDWPKLVELGSKPAAITPPSRICVAGSAADRLRHQYRPLRIDG